MPPEIDTWRTVGLVFTLTMVYFMFRCFEFTINNLEDGYFKRATKRMLFFVLFLELYLAVVTVAFSKIGIYLFDKEETIYMLMLFQAAFAGIVVGVIVANLKRKYPEGLYEHFWFKYIQERGSQPS